MSDSFPPCPECDSSYTYELGGLLTCPMCAHEWTADDGAADAAEGGAADEAVRDAVGNVLQDGDAVTIVKTLKVKGAQQPLKAGTKVSSIRLVDGVGDHDIEARIEGFGQMQLKSSIVKKA